MKRQWYYRGSLKFCNYSCSYCPFSKKAFHLQGLKKDQEAFSRFTERMLLKENGGAVLVVPYGEALLYSYYWEGLAALSRIEAMDAVGAQSNFSFPVGQMLDVYEAHGGALSKLRLWGTFHPEMTSAEQFAKQCRLLEERRVSFCVGAVGVPERLDQIRRLRGLLPDAVSFWINRMDGRKQPYADAEIEAFMDIDAYFWQELRHHKTDGRHCADNRFVEADGTMRRCNISRQVLGNFYDDSGFRIEEGRMRDCKRRECSCYLAYCNRTDEPIPFMGQYPAFRIPTYPKAVFFDIDGTLVPKGEKQISKETEKRLIRLAKRCDIYLATSLPLRPAKKKLAPVWHLIRGGVFANGGRWGIWGPEGRRLDVAAPMEAHWLERVREKKEEYGFSLHVYRKGADIYKVTLLFARSSHTAALSEERRSKLEREWKIPDSCRVVWEENCIQVTKRGTGKLEGILEICREMGYQREEVAAFGDSENDREMLAYFPGSIRVGADSVNEWNNEQRRKDGSCFKE